MYCNALVIAANITYWISHNYNRTPLTTHKTDRLFPTTSNSDRPHPHKPDRLFPHIKQRSPITTYKPNHVSMLLFYNEMSYIVQCNDTK
ncbi:hypothetical protein [Pseudanabaena sp. UWO310]|uniref:hypothetical protein n=1 Tax=Pseudanabaena sp. UWO310 TaxID=2480795 RepID=UPI001158198A|nr:hypothetical protein [Pseudanabaena sp. UWO310]TYQ29871.1 hypothetical protein PseudUWO310_11765 [Pseudanabaena sp. UWO310]